MGASTWIMLGLNNLPLVINEYLTVEKSGKKTLEGGTAGHLEKRFGCGM